MIRAIAKGIYFACVPITLYIYLTCPPTPEYIITVLGIFLVMAVTGWVFLSNHGDGK